MPRRRCYQNQTDWWQQVLEEVQVPELQRQVQRELQRKWMGQAPTMPTPEGNQMDWEWQAQLLPTKPN
jgi:hypothetical protein